MSWLFAALGIDYGQWKTLTRVMLKLDLRSASQIGANLNAEKSSQRQVLLMLGIFYGMTGLFLVVLALVPNVFFGASMMITVVMFMIGSMVLIEYQSVVISPDDHAILGFQPISPRTYFAVKLTNVLVYVSVLAIFLGAPTVVTHLIRNGVGASVAAAAGIYSAVLFVTLSMIVAYGAVLRFVHPLRLRRALSYVQMLMSVLMYSSYLVFPRLVDREALDSLQGFQIDKTVWVLLYPPTWYASLLDLGVGNHGATELVPAAIGIAAVLGLFWYSTDRLSLSYAERLEALTSVSEAKTPSAATAARAKDDAPRRRWIMSRNEARAVSILVRAQFRYDMKFRMAVIGMLPITGLYVFMALERGPLPDPFTDAGFGSVGQLGLLHVAMVFLPAMLLENLATSDSFRAAWVFFATPADKARLVLGARTVVSMSFGLPYMVFVACIFAWHFESVWHAIVHVIVFGLISNLVLQVFVYVRPQLPFAKPAQKSQRSGIFLFVGLSAMFGVAVVLPWVLGYAYARPGRTAVTIVVLLIGNLLLERLVARRSAALVTRIEFAS